VQVSRHLDLIKLVFCLKKNLRHVKKFKPMYSNFPYDTIFKFEWLFVNENTTMYTFYYQSHYLVHVQVVHLNFNLFYLELWKIMFANTRLDYYVIKYPL
jgi:hypothetical protein